MRNDMMKKFETFDSGNGHSFCSSSYMTYINDGKSKPKYYEATSTTRSAPGEIKETRKTVRDSEKELENQNQNIMKQHQQHEVLQERSKKRGKLFVIPKKNWKKWQLDDIWEKKGK